MVDERRTVAALPALARLGSLREKRALAALGEAEAARRAALAERDAQRAEVDELERELGEAIAEAATERAPTVASLLHSAERRRWLHERLTKERGTMDERESELGSAEAVAGAARGEWLRARERGAALERRGRALRRDAERRLENRADTDRAVAVAADGAGR